MAGRTGTDARCCPDCTKATRDWSAFRKLQTARPSLRLGRQTAGITEVESIMPETVLVLPFRVPGCMGTRQAVSKRTVLTVDTASISERPARIIGSCATIIRPKGPPNDICSSFGRRLMISHTFGVKLGVYYLVLYTYFGSWGKSLTSTLRYLASYGLG